MVRLLGFLVSPTSKFPNICSISQNFLNPNPAYQSKLTVYPLSYGLLLNLREHPPKSYVFYLKGIRDSKSSTKKNHPETMKTNQVFKKNKMCTLQGTNISPKNGILKMIFLFPRWDMLIPWRVSLETPSKKTVHLKKPSPPGIPQAPPCPSGVHQLPLPWLSDHLNWLDG